jgi:hypothetical protein
MVFRKGTTFVPGRHVTDHQMRLFMKLRQNHTTETASAKAGLSRATGYRLLQAPVLPSQKREPRQRRRPDPLIEAPIYSLEELYRREAKSLWAKAVAATSLYPVAVILFDSPSARSAVLGNLFSPPARLTTGSAFGRKRVENAPPAMVRAVTHTGRCVMLTTPETFAEDWQGGAGRDS